MAEAILGQNGASLGNGYALYAYGEQRSRDVPNNRSKVYVEAKLTSGGMNWSSSYASYIRVYWHDNRENYDRICYEVPIYTCAYNSSYYASGEIWVTHNSDGSLSGYVYATFTKGGTSSYAPSTGGVTTNWTALWSVPRASTPSIDGTIYTGTTCEIKTNRASSSFTHVLSYTFGSKSGWIADSDHKVGDKCNWTIPSNFAEEYASDSNSMNCTITCDTYNNSTYIGTKTYTKAIILNTNVKPTISSATSQDGNTIIRNLNLSVYLSGKSYPELSISASGTERSTISTYYAALNPADDTEAEANAVSATSVSNLNNLVKNFNLIPGTNTIKVWVTDSRGYKSLKSSISILARSYTSPNIEDFSVLRCKSSSNLEPDDEGTSVRLSAAGSITDILASNGSTHKNVMYCKTRYRQAPDGDWTNLTNLSGGVSGYSFNKKDTNSVNLAGTFPTTSKYDIEIYLYDTISLAESGWDGTISSNPEKPTEEQLAKLTKKTASILTGFDLMHFHKSGKSVSFGKKSEAGDSDKMFEIRMNQIKFEGATNIDGNTCINGDLIVNGDLVEFLPIGTILPYSSINVPRGYMICDGRELSRTDYSDLFDVIGTNYGVGNGSTTFNIPNLTGRVPVGINSADSTFENLGNSGGEKTHTLTTNEMPSHTHIPTWQSNCPPWLQAGGYGQISPSASGGANKANIGNLSINNTGGGQAHNNLQPYVVITYIIKVASGTADVPDSITITNSDVLQINQNKNDITGLTSKTNNLSTYSSNEINTGATWIDGKPIYRKVVNTGQMPSNTTSKFVATGISGTINVIKLYGMAKTNDNFNITLPEALSGYMIRLSFRGSDNNIQIQAQTDRSAYTSSFVVIEYTKVTS